MRNHSKHTRLILGILSAVLMALCALLSLTTPTDANATLSQGCPETTPLFNPTKNAPTATPSNCKTSTPTKTHVTPQATSTRLASHPTPTLPGRFFTPFFSSH